MARRTEPQGQATLWGPDEQASLYASLPANAYAERVLLGSCLLNSRRNLPLVRTILQPEDFMTQSNQTIYRMMLTIDERGDYVDRVTLANALMAGNALEKIGGLTYLASLDNDMPEVVNLESYVAIVRDKSVLRKIIQHASAVQQKCFQSDQAPAEILADFEERVLGVYQASKDEDAAESFEEVVGAFGGIDAYFRRDFSKAVITPWTDHNKLLGFVMPGQLICIAARPACGKTVCGLQFAARAARSVETHYYTLEETKRGLYDRLISAYAAVDFSKVQLGESALDKDDLNKIYHASGEISALKLRINDRAGRSIYSLRSHLIKARSRKRPAQVVVIDYLQLMQGGSRGSKRHDEISDITRGLKLLAEEFQVVIVMLSQLNREVEKRPGGKPQLSDLRESGTIEQDSDKVLLLWRPELYSQDPSFEGVFTAIVAKNRQGRVGEANMIFQGQYQRVMSAKAVISQLPVFGEDPPINNETRRRVMGEEAA